MEQGHRSQPVYLVPAAGRGGDECLYVPHAWCAWSVRVYLLASIKLDQSVNSRVLGSRLGDKVGWGSMLACPRGLVNVACMRKKCVCVHAAKFKMDYPVSRLPVNWVRGPESRKRCWVDTGTVLVLEASANVCMHVNVESAACVSSLVTCVSAKQRGRGTWICLFHEPFVQCC